VGLAASRAHAARRPPERRARHAIQRPSQPRRSGLASCTPRGRAYRGCRAPRRLGARAIRVSRPTRAHAVPRPRRMLVGRARSHAWLDPPAYLCLLQGEVVAPPLPARSTIKAHVGLLVRARARCTVAAVGTDLPFSLTPSAVPPLLHLPLRPQELPPPPIAPH
jgi:hypothetical protein